LVFVQNPFVHCKIELNIYFNLKVWPTLETYLGAQVISKLHFHSCHNYFSTSHRGHGNQNSSLIHVTQISVMNEIMNTKQIMHSSNGKQFLSFKILWCLMYKIRIWVWDTNVSADTIIAICKMNVLLSCLSHLPWREQLHLFATRLETLKPKN